VAAATSTDRTALISFDRLSCPVRYGPVRSPSPSLGRLSRDNGRIPASRAPPPRSSAVFFRRRTTPTAVVQPATGDAASDYDGLIELAARAIICARARHADRSGWRTSPSSGPAGRPLPFRSRRSAAHRSGCRSIDHCIWTSID